VKSRKRL